MCIERLEKDARCPMRREIPPHVKIPTFKSEIYQRFTNMSFWLNIHYYIICQYISIGVIVLKMFLTMNK